MKLITFLHMLAILSGCAGFLISIWQHEVSLFPLACAFYALGAMLDSIIIKDN